MAMEIEKSGVSVAAIYRPLNNIFLNKMRSLLGVEKELPFSEKLIFSFSKKSVKFCKSVSLVFFCKFAGTSSLKSSKKNSDIFKIDY